MSGKKGTISAIALLVAFLSLLSTGAYANEKDKDRDKEKDTSEHVVALSERILFNQAGPIFSVPSGKILVVTDVVIQNRAAGDTPVDPFAFSRVVLGPFSITGRPRSGQGDIVFTVVGNDTLNLHFTTGMRAPTSFRVYDVINSTAPYIEYMVTGYLVPAEESGEHH